MAENWDFCVVGKQGSWCLLQSIRWAGSREPSRINGHNIRNCLRKGNAQTVVVVFGLFFKLLFTAFPCFLDCSFLRSLSSSQSSPSFAPKGSQSHNFFDASFGFIFSLKI